MAKAKREHVVSEKLYTRQVAGKALFPHALAVQGGRTIFLSGQLAWDRNGEAVGKRDMRAQYRQVCENLKEALTAAGAGLADIVKTNTYVTDMDEFFKCVDIRQEYFGPAWPTSTTVEVAGLAHPDMMVEIKAIAVAN